ncbi:hypothetical protein EYF80_067229 [Liparis tanakae]|uniref:Uncharacterized protein n=1 Tax=Liparis tanakae TaxID=230148 RepID=A0A4Z2E1B5_9TELE|nr:hypothetical protein EYF80_067229 [Liparis tanakae]
MVEGATDPPALAGQEGPRQGRQHMASGSKETPEWRRNERLSPIPSIRATGPESLPFPCPGWERRPAGGRFRPLPVMAKLSDQVR